MLKQALSQHQKIVTKSARELEKALRAYDDTVEADTRELILLRKVDVELARASFDLEIVIKLIVQGALDLINATCGDLLLPADSEQLRVAWSTRAEELVAQLVPIYHSITGKAFRTGETQLVSNIGDIKGDYFELVPGMQSELAVPMKVENGEVLGVINLESTEPGWFTLHHSELVQVLAGQAAIGFRNARLYTELMTIVDTQGRLLSETGSLRRTLSLIGERAKQLVGAEGCQVLKKDGDGLVIEYTTGREPLGTRVLVNDSVSGLAVLSREVQNIEDVHSDPRAKSLYKDVLGGMRSELVVPLVAENEVLGVINFESPLRSAFKGREYLVKLFADQAAMAILNARRVEELLAAKQSQSELWTMAQIGDIAANLVHRLNSDVGAAKVLVDEIRYREAELLRSNPFLASRLDDIYNMALRALDIPRQLRTRIEKADQYEIINVNTVIKEVKEVVDIPAGVQIKLDKLDPLIPQVETVLQFDEVLKNLIQNAFDAMPDGGVLEIQTKPWVIEQARDKPIMGVEIRVSDTGIGIPKEIQDKIFEIRTSQKKQRQGLGFGLWWVKSFMDRIGGEVGFTSKEGEGTTFWLRIPKKSKRPESIRS